MMLIVNALAWLEKEPEIDTTKVTPGPIGFIITALFVVAVVLLLINLNRRLRRNQYRAEIRESLAAELAERDAQLDAEASGTSEPADAAATSETAATEQDDDAGTGSSAEGADPSGSKQ